MLLDAGRDRQDVRIENDVVGIESDLIDKDAVSPFADADFLVIGGRLALFIEGHHHHSGPVFHDVPCGFPENILAFLERDRIHDPLALEVFQAFLKDLPFR